MIAQILFIALCGVATYFFAKNVGKIRRNILLGKDIDLTDNKPERWKTMLKVAFGQTKMAVRPVPFVLHFIVYAGFILINIEVLEILIDGIFGTHRVLSFLGPVYDVAIGFFEILAFGVLVSCIVFLARRYIVKLARFQSPELKGFANRDAATILFIEIILMGALLKMNAADQILQARGIHHYIAAGSFPISSWLVVPIYNLFSTETLIYTERIAWWFHIIGIFLFMNYLPFSKHFHVIMAFPNTWYSNLKAKGNLNNMASVTQEVKLMLDPSAVVPEGYEPPTSFGVKDVTDLTWKNLMDAYTCTECGRCTSVCPQNQTGKVLSPRKIMMDTRDRLDEVGKNIDANNGSFVDDQKNLHSYISEAELWACNTCNACVEACPININPMEIIVEMRRFKVMEQSSAPAPINSMFTNMENNQAPWQFSPMDRANWTQE
ncbi:MAG: (Fe-S)-binding protein [Bacteroidia bacterium]|nr:(Fe-S)-binding protein [Bacteroidia bacterium]MCF8427023.1 (Fe-S)-binding protein [Bacteroidia bacterium]MCF8446483.1 (Fe-S)-binding protein [Bacteroidia bacterium]